MNTTIELVWVDVKDIKTTYYHPDHESEIVNAVSKAGKVMLPVTHASVHKGTMELLSQGIYLQVAKQEGAEKILVALVDFPEEYLLQAVASHWTPPREYAKIAPLIPVFSDYYSSRRKGAGAIFREDTEDQKLVDFVAALFRTNRTYLGYIKAIHEFEPTLLQRVDSGEISLPDAHALVPRKTKDGKRKQAKRGEQKTTPKNYLEPVKEFTEDERRLIADNLPERLRVEFDANPGDSPISVSRQYMYDGVYQGLYISYQYEGRSVVIQIVDNKGLTDSLVA